MELALGILPDNDIEQTWNKKVLCNIWTNNKKITGEYTPYSLQSDLGRHRIFIVLYFVFFVITYYGTNIDCFIWHGSLLFVQHFLFTVQYSLCSIYFSKVRTLCYLMEAWVTISRRFSCVIGCNKNEFISNDKFSILQIYFSRACEHDYRALHMIPEINCFSDLIQKYSNRNIQ